MKRIKLALCMLTLLGMSFSNICYSTIVFQEDFEHPGCNFINGCVPGWINTHGNAQTVTNYHTTGSHAARVYAYYSNFYCNPAKYIGAGIALNFNFKPGFQYKITYDISSEWGTSEARWVVTNGFSNGLGQQNSCSPIADRLIPGIPGNSQILANNIFTSNTQTWHTGVVNQFIAGSNSTQLWLYCRNERYNPDNTSEIHTYIYVDNIIIEELCGPPVVNFNMQNQSGTIKSNFCLGEDVIINGSGSSDELGYMISIQDVTGPTYPVPTDLIAPNGTTWFQDTMSVKNLSEVLANSNPSYKLLPGRTYKIRLALYNSCTSWISSDQIITVNCCPNFINPSFQLNSLAITSGVYKLTADNYNRYPNINSTHLWYVYKYTNSNGPFTYVTTINNPEFNFFGNNMQCYLVIHKIITPCGEVCYGQKICNNAGLVGGGLSGGPFVGLIPGCVLPPVCQAPNQLGCVPLPGSIYPNARQLRWNNVPGAVSYQLVRVYNDPLCCNGTPIITLPPVTISPNSLLPYTSFDVEPDYLGSCFSWKIIVTCSNGLTATSAPKCFGPTYPCDWGSPIGSMNRMAITGNIEEPEISAFPNPVTDGILKLSIQGVDQNLVTDMIVYSMDGRRVINSKYKGNCVESVNVSNLPAGLYFLKAFQNNNQVYVTKFEKR